MSNVCISLITYHSDSVFSILQYSFFSPETHTPDIYDISAFEENGPKSWKFGINDIKGLYWFPGFSVCRLEFLNPVNCYNGF